MQVNVGDVVLYRLPLSAQPIKPLRLWRGKVLKVVIRYVQVEVQEPGYENTTEWVSMSQIVPLRF